jgi:DNA-binding response OmpR family regulator
MLNGATIRSVTAAVLFATVSTSTQALLSALFCSLKFFVLLARLVRQAGQVVTRRRLLADVWGAEYTEHTHYLRLYMAQLRAKLERDPAEPRRLLNEPGVGYRIIEGAD